MNLGSLTPSHWLPAAREAAWPAPAEAAGLGEGEALRGEIEPQAVGLPVVGHVERIVAHLLEP